MYGPVVAGWFMLGHRIVGLPVSLVSKSVAQVYLGESAQEVWGSVHLVRRRFHRTAGRLAALVALPASAMLLFAPALFSWVFGGAWREAGIYVQLLTLMFVGRFVVTSLSHTLTILERQDRQFLWDLGRVVLVVAAITIPSMLEAPARVAVVSYSLAMLAAYAVLYLVMDISLVRHHR
jgi:O-antigen/teichoic acid export membrane protein